MKLILVFIAVLIAFFGYSQKSVTYTIKPGAFIMDVIPSTEVFRYPAFTQGIVTFKDGKSTSGSLNYNMLIGTVQFIDAKSDTLSLANEETIQHIVINNDLYYFNRGYFRVIDTSKGMMLSELIYFKNFSEKQSSYGMSSSTAASDNFSSILERRAYNLTAAEEMKLVKHTEYAILDHAGTMIYPDKKKLLKIFPDNKTAVSNYLSKNSADPSKKEELVKLINFLTEL
ncbi:hypothetical protein [Flavitalea sp.]|nr:hypothetical protein [Flavitalea sp.]